MVTTGLQECLCDPSGGPSQVVTEHGETAVRQEDVSPLLENMKY